MQIHQSDSRKSYSRRNHLIVQRLKADPAGDHQSTGGDLVGDLVTGLAVGGSPIGARRCPVSAGGPQAGHPAAARSPALQRPSARASTSLLVETKAPEKFTTLVMGWGEASGR